MKIEDVKEIKPASNFRYVVLVLGFLFFSAVHTGFIAYNCAFVAMTDLKSSPLWVENMTREERADIDFNSHDIPIHKRRFDFSASQKGWTFAAGFTGSLLAVPLGSFLMVRYGSHRSMTVFGICVAIFNYITPLSCTYSFVTFVIIRVLCGTAKSILYAATGDVVSKWAPTSERGLWIAVLSGHVELSPLFSMPHAGFMASAVSWPAIFYSHGTIIATLSILWGIFYRDHASDIKYVSDSEVLFIQEGKIKQGTKPVPPPLLKIATTPVILGIWTAVIGYFYTVQFMITFIPIYFHGALGYSTMDTGLLCMIPLASLLGMKFLVGHISDKLSVLNEKQKMRLFNTLAYFGSAILFVVAALRSPTGSFVDVLCIVLPVGILGIHAAGFPKCAVMVSKQFSSTVFSYMQIFGCTGGVIGSFVIPALTPNGSHEEWRSVFWMYGAVMIITNIVFVYFAQDKPCKWVEAKQQSAEVTSA